MKTLLSIILLINLAYASSTSNGLRVYKKNCQSCHGSGGYAAKQLNKSQWLDYFYFNAIKLKKAHKNDSKVMNKLKSISKKKLANLEAFLTYQAKDSGYVDGCNGDSCGLISGQVKISK